MLKILGGSGIGGEDFEYGAGSQRLQRAPRLQDRQRTQEPGRIKCSVSIGLGVAHGLPRGGSPKILDDAEACGDPICRRDALYGVDNFVGSRFYPPVMTTILQILVSPRPNSFSRLIAREVAARLVRLHPGARVIDRDLAGAPPPHPDLTLYDAILSPEDNTDPRFALSELLIGELEAADWVVIGTPMNNFAVPSTLKAWIDHIVRIRRTFASTAAGKVGLLPDRPVIVVSAHGGFCGDTPPDQPDFLTPYLRAIFHTIGIDRVEFIRLEGMTRGPEHVARALAGARDWIARRLPPPAEMAEAAS
jgi:FMN-dependent NADH-azoreductase